MVAPSRSVSISEATLSGESSRTPQGNSPSDARGVTSSYRPTPRRCQVQLGRKRHFATTAARKGARSRRAVGVGRSRRHGARCPTPATPHCEVRLLGSSPPRIGGYWIGRVRQKNVGSPASPRKDVLYGELMARRFPKPLERRRSAVTRGQANSAFRQR